MTTPETVIARDLGFAHLGRLITVDQLPAGHALQGTISQIGLVEGHDIAVTVRVGEEVITRFFDPDRPVSLLADPAF